MLDTADKNRIPVGKLTDLAHETLKTFSLTHNYNLWIIRLFAPYIGKKILEIGSGIGNLTFYLQHFGDLSGIDISDYYLAHIRIDFPDLAFYQYDVSGDAIVALKKHDYDTVICVNVLEHVRDDKKAAANIYQILKPGGRLLVYVPAVPLLYGSVDKNLMHHRRYDKKKLETLLQQAGFSVERIFFSNFIALFGWFFNSRIQRKKELSYWQTMLFDKFAPIFEMIERCVKPPVGMSLVAIARKSDFDF